MKRIIFGAILGWIAFCFYSGKITLADFDTLPDVKHSMESQAITKPLGVVVIPFYYDATNAPKGITTERVLSAIETANKEWGNACNIHFKYLGNLVTDYSTHVDDSGLIRWDEFEDSRTLGETTQGSSSGPAFDFVMTLSVASFTTKSSRATLLDHVVIHELGHAIAFNHSNNPKSIMYYSVDVGKTIPTSLNENDAAACRYYRYRWRGLSIEQSSKKAGILVDES